AASLVGVAVILPSLLPILPVSDVHDLPASSQQSSLGDTIGWPQLTRAIAAQDAALARAGQPPTSIFTGYYPPAARAVRPQRLLDVGTRPGLRPHRPRGRRARPATALLRPLPPAHHLPRPLPPDQRLD